MELFSWSESMEEVRDILPCSRCACSLSNLPFLWEDNQQSGAIKTKNSAFGKKLAVASQLTGLSRRQTGNPASIPLVSETKLGRMCPIRRAISLITCNVRYVLDPYKIDKFERYAKMWIPL